MCSSPIFRSASLRHILLALTWVLAAMGCGATQAATWLVGPKPPAMGLREALTLAGDGDTVVLLEGQYEGHNGVITQKPFRASAMQTWREVAAAA